ncbi:MAG: hypothetical protein Q8M08_05570 [Bacteroidales bacterium]|nr:hypothetical protein [Bacteroidales bacterium]
MNDNEKDEYLKDDFLREFMQDNPLDSPSDDFTGRVMASIQNAPEAVVMKQPFYLYLKTAIPYLIISLIIFVVIATSDLPIFNWIPGKDYLMNSLLPYFETMFMVFKKAFTSKYVSWGLLISFSAGILFLIDRMFSRRASV